MSVFGKIMGAIFGTPAKAATPDAAAPASAPAAGAAPASAPAAGANSASLGAPTVDIPNVLDAAVAKAGQQLNWRTSIVDLMKALNLDSSLASRKELAHELGYKGDTNDSASMNIWLHEQVIAKLASNNGQATADLLKHHG